MNSIDIEVGKVYVVKYRRKMMRMKVCGFAQTRVGFENSSRKTILARFKNGDNGFDSDAVRIMPQNVIMLSPNQEA